MKDTIFDVIVVGAGISGLSASYHLKKYGLNHIVFERGKIGESWRSQRWDSFTLNSLNKLNALAGLNYKKDDPNGFDTAPGYVASFEQYVSEFNLPIVENTRVVSIEKPSGIFNVTVASDNVLRNYSSRQVIIASGCESELLFPPLTKKIPANIQQFHSGQYRNPGQLPGGAVLVIGSGQSGCQIAEDLANAGRKVYLSTSMVGRVPRWYRGKDIMEWLLEMKFFDVKAEQIEDPAMLTMKAPQITGAGGNKHTIGLQALAKKGVVILGRTEKMEGQDVFIQPNGVMHVKFADGFSKNVKEMIDGFIVGNQLNAPAPETDAADKPDENADCVSPVTSLNFAKDNIHSIIWATGFTGDFSYIKLPVFDKDQNLKHKEGVTEVPGLYFLGYPWLRNRKSFIIVGLKEDAEFIVEKVYNHSRENSPSVSMAV